MGRVYIVGTPSDTEGVYSNIEAAIAHARTEDWLSVWAVPVHNSFPPPNETQGLCVYPVADL